MSHQNVALFTFLFCFDNNVGKKFAKMGGHLLNVCDHNYVMQKNHHASTVMPVCIRRYCAYGY